MNFLRVTLIRKNAALGCTVSGGPRQGAFYRGKNIPLFFPNFLERFLDKIFHVSQTAANHSTYVARAIKYRLFDRDNAVSVTSCSPVFRYPVEGSYRVAAGLIPLSQPCSEWCGCF